MFDYSTNGVTVCLVRDTRKKEPESECPIRWRVTFNRKQVYYSSGVKLLPNEWISLEKSKNLKLKEIRESLQTFFDNVIKKHVKELAEDDTFTFDTLNMRLGKASVTTVNLAFQSKIDDLLSKNSVGNANVYKCASNSVEAFGGKNIQFTEITPIWLKRYQTFMELKKMKYTTIGMYMRTLRAILNDVMTQNLIKPSAYPFGRGKYEIPTGAGRDMALVLDDIKKIAAFVCPTKTIEKSRDLWLFSFYCNGANFGDLCRFTYDNIDNGEIYFYRKKTLSTTSEKREIIAPILPPMLDIIEKWGNVESNKNTFLFPFLNGCKTEVEMKHEIHNVIRLVNKHIKIVTKELNLPDISTYNARHSYATILAKKRVPESYIAEQLGHSNKTITQNYFGSYSKEERTNYNSLLL